MIVFELTRVLKPVENPLGATVLPVSLVGCVTRASGSDPIKGGAPKGTILELSSGNSWQVCLKLIPLLD